MTYSYSNPVTYGPQQNGVYYEDPSKKKKFTAGSAAATGVVLGGTVGAIIGARNKSFVSKEGEFTDSFVRTTYDNYMNKAGENSSKAYKESLKILKKIDSVSSPEELKNLLNANPEAAEEICNELKKSPDDFLKNVTKRNLNKNKRTIKTKINANNTTRLQDMRNQIDLCWDANKRKFIKHENVSDDVFNVIKNTKNKIKWSAIGKNALVGAVCTGIFGFAFTKIFNKKYS
ncbi:hypothetical protein IKB17_01940 [bacterium]|nr:hypothetical protein [bacterium]